MRDLNPNSSQNRRILILLNYKTLDKSPKNPFIFFYPNKEKNNLKKFTYSLFQIHFSTNSLLFFYLLKFFFNSLYFLLL